MDRLRPNGKDFKVREGFRFPAVVIEAGSEIVPCVGKREILPVTLSPFKDHGRRAYLASTIKSRSVFQEAAGALSEEDSQRLNSLLLRTMDSLLEEGTIRDSAVIFRSTEERPDIHVLTLGNTFKDSSLRLYCHLGEYDGARVIFQDARSTRKGAERVERVFAREGGYQIPSGWKT